MGHDKPLTTLNSYGHVPVERQAEIIGTLGRQALNDSPHEALATVIAKTVADFFGTKRD